jgi:hypothetical protein
MEKKYIIGGLAIVGAIALIAYLKPKNKLNSDGFYNASGRYGLGCRVCQRQDGTTYFAQSGYCISGDSCFSSITKTKKLQ